MVLVGLRATRRESTNRRFADTTKCNRMFHCYKKCAAVKNGGGEDGMVSTKRAVMQIEEAAPLVAGKSLSCWAHSFAQLRRRRPPLQP